MRSAVVAFLIAFGLVVLFFGTLVRAHGGSRVVVGPRPQVGSWDGGIRTMSPPVTAFRTVQANGSMDIKVERGTTPSVTFHARADVLPYLTADVSDGVLSIGMKDGYQGDTGDVTATVVAPKVEGVILNGSGNVDVEAVSSDGFAGAINGSGNLSATGKTLAAKFQVAGSGNVEASDLAADTVTVDISGSGDASVKVAKKLDATVSGSGDVHYSGKPIDVHQNVMGSGSVSADN